MTTTGKKMAVWKFASCDGCQLSLLDLEDELLALADRLVVVYRGRLAATLDRADATRERLGALMTGAVRA